MDTEAGFSVVFRGEIATLQDIVRVKKLLVNFFKATPEKIDSLFSGKQVTIKKGLSMQQAKDFQEQLTKLGLITYLLDSNRKIIGQERERQKSPTNVNPFPAKNASLSLVPLESTPTQNDVPIEDEEISEKRSFEFPAIKPFSLIFSLLGLLLIVFFSPYPDWIVKKGFVLGCFTFAISTRKLLSK